MPFLFLVLLHNKGVLLQQFQILLVYVPPLQHGVYLDPGVGERIREYINCFPELRRGNRIFEVLEAVEVEFDVVGGCGGVVEGLHVVVGVDELQGEDAQRKEVGRELLEVREGVEVGVQFLRRGEALHPPLAAAPDFLVPLFLLDEDAVPEFY